MADRELNFVGPDSRVALRAARRAEAAAALFQSADPNLVALASLTLAANKLIYATAVDTLALTDLTAFARSILDDGDAATARATLGVTLGTNVQAHDATLDALAGLTVAANKLIYATGADAFATTDLTAFARSILDDADAAAVRTTLGLVLGTNVQAYDATLTAIAAVSTAADKLIYATGTDTFAATDITAFARTVLAAVDADALNTLLGGAGDANLPTVVQTQLRPGDVLERFTETLTGAAVDVVDASGTVTTTDDLGAVLRVAGGTIIGTRERAALIPGHLYRIRASFARSTDPADPAGDAVRLGVQWLNKNKAAVSQRALVDSAPVIADGRVTVSAVVADTAGTGVDFAWPATARYMVPFLQFYGSVGVTDIAALEWEDITDYPTAEQLADIAAAAAEAEAQADRAENEADGAEGSATAAGTDRALAQAAAASAGTSANNALGTTTTDPRYKLWRLTATTNVALTGQPVIDGKQTVTGDRVFVPVQTNGAQNGIYLIPASGAWSRTSDADSAADVANMYGYATDGLKNVGREFRLSTTATITLGTTPLNFIANAYGESQDFMRRHGVCVIVGDSNRNGRIDYYTALPLELTGVARPWEDWTVYNMAQNGSQLAGWIAAIATADPNQAPADYTGLTSPTNFWQVCNANPDVIIMSLGINDRNSVANRAGTPGQNFAENLNTAIMFLLQNSNATIILEVPQPYTGINFVAGAFTTGWDVDFATWGQANAADNAAYWSRRNREDYLAWRGRNPRVLVHDTAEIFNPGVTYNPLLHRCDNPKVNCLDPDAAKIRFVGSITGDVLTVTALYSSGSIAVGDVIAPTAYGTGAGRTVTSLGTGTGGLGTYNLSAGSNVASSVMKVPAYLLDDSLHFASTGARRILESFSHQFGLVGRRKLSSFVGSEQGVDPYYTIFQSAYWSATFFYSGRSVSVGNALINIYPSPEAVILQGSPHDRRGGGRAAQYDLLSFAEHTILREDLARIKQLESLRGTIVKMMVIGGTGTIYTATAVALSSISTNTNFYHTVQFNGVDLAAEAASGRLVVWVEDPSALPFVQKQCSGVLPPGTAAIASIAIPNPSTFSAGWPIRRVKACRFAATDGAMSIDVGLTNQTGDNRLIDGSITTASLPYVIGTLTFSASALDVTMTPNQTNIDAAIAAGISWPAPGGSASGHARFKSTYRLTFIPSITITKPITVFASE
jgi:hypothetical protein